MITDSVTAWVAAAPDARNRDLRQAVHTVLVAISTAPHLPKVLVMKGGILLALRHAGDRYTTDIDFSTTQTQSEMQPDAVLAELAQSLALAVQSLSYGMDCRIQSHELRPPDVLSSWPTLAIRIGYAAKLDARRHSRLLRGEAIDVVSVDLSYNEVITAVEVLEISGGAALTVSDLSDLLGEKYRAMLQQTVRRRTRRQDMYDIYRLLAQPEAHDVAVRAAVLTALRQKSAARNLPVHRDSLCDAEIRARSRAQYEYLRSEISSQLPDFDESFDAVRAFYESLPWE